MRIVWPTHFCMPLDETRTSKYIIPGTVRAVWHFHSFNRSMYYMVLIVEIPMPCVINSYLVYTRKHILPVRILMYTRFALF